jgi:hypothetical protein
MLCLKCGKENPEDAKFCDMCGAAMPQQDSAALNTAEPQTAPKQIKQKTKIIIISAVALVIVIAATVGIVALHNTMTVGAVLNDALERECVIEISMIDSDGEYEYYVYGGVLMNSNSFQSAPYSKQVEGIIIKSGARTIENRDYQSDKTQQYYSFNSNFTGEYISKTGKRTNERRKFTWSVAEFHDSTLREMSSTAERANALYGFNLNPETWLHIDDAWGNEMYICNKRFFFAEADTSEFFELYFSSIICDYTGDVDAEISFHGQDGEIIVEMSFDDGTVYYKEADYDDFEYYGEWNVANDFDPNSLTVISS